MKNRILALTLALSTLLFGCGMAFTLANMPAAAADTSDTLQDETSDAPVQEHTDPQASTDDDSIVKTQQLNNYDSISLRTGGIGASKTVLVIQNKEALEKYYDENRSSYSLDKRCGTLSFEEAMRQYAEKFFSENVLLIVQLSENDVSMIPEVSGLSNDGTIYIERTIDPSAAASSQQWHILISLPKDHDALDTGHFHVIEY